MENSKLEIKRIGVFSVVKTCFILGGVSGFVLGFVKWMLLGVLVSALQNSPVQPGILAEPEIEEALSDLIRVGGILLPLLGGLFGSAIGVVGGYILSQVYNLGSRVLGGIEIETAPVAVAAKPAPVQTTSPGMTTPLPGQQITRPTTPPDTNDDKRPADSSPNLFE